MKELLAKYDKREITKEELDTECAYWLMDTFQDIRWKPFPSMPQEYSEFMNMPYEKRIKISNEIHQNQKIKEYLDEKSRIKNENRSNLLNLKDFKLHIPIEDSVSRSRYDQKIYEFEDRYSGKLI